MADTTMQQPEVAIATPTPTAPAPAQAVAAPAVHVAESVRMKRMLQILKKALDVSVSSASSINLRAFFADECREEPELLPQLFASTAASGNAALTASDAEQQQEVYAGELSAQALQQLRRQIETAFRGLCERHEINSKLATLESTIEEAQRAKIEQLANKQLEYDTDSKRLNESTLTTAETEGDANVDAGSTPEELIRAERIRVMEAEKKNLEALVKRLQTQKDEQQTRLNIKRELATNAIEDVQQVSQQMTEALVFAKDYAATA